MPAVNVHAGGTAAASPSSRRGFAPREFSGVQFHEVEHACRRLAGEFDEVIRHAVIPPLHVKFGHRREVVDEVRWHPQLSKLSVHAESGTLR